MITYSYAYNECGEFVCIDSLSKEERFKHSYTCISCEKEMIPRMGECNAWHFAHKTNEACNGERYIHKLAKNMLQKKFYSNPKFEFIIKQKAACVLYDKCKFSNENECHGVSPSCFDLKDKNKYDICDVEQTTCGGRFTPDVLISDSSGRNKDIWIEIWVTHKSTDEKRNSGFPIIEIKIENESQVNDLISNPIGHSEATYKVEYINFKKESNKKIKPPLVRRLVDYFYIDYTGRAHIDEGRCENQYRNNESEAFKLAIDFSFGVRNNYHVALLYCLRHNKRTCYCPLCFFYGDSLLGNICKRYRTKGTPHYPMSLPVLDCPYFREDRQRIQMLEKQLEEATIVEIE